MDGRCARAEDVSADLAPLSYVAGVLCGDPDIYAWVDDADGLRTILPAPEALRLVGLKPFPLLDKEHLGILNGTAFSAAVAALVLYDAAHITLLTQLCTAMSVEALLGSRDSFRTFIHATARPHPGQVSFFAVGASFVTDAGLGRLRARRSSMGCWKGALLPRQRMKRRPISSKTRAPFDRIGIRCAQRRNLWVRPWRTCCPR
jgi:hypothetical protein